MAYTITPSTTVPVDVWGHVETRFVTLTPAVADYATGGYALTPGQGISLSKVYWAIPVGNQGGITPVWNASTGYLQMFGANPYPSTPLALGTASTTSTNVAVVARVITIAVTNTVAVGQFVYLQSLTAGGALNGTIVQAVTGTNSSTLVANYGLAVAITSTADATGTLQVVQTAGGSPLTAGTSATVTASATTAGTSTGAVLTVTAANTFKQGQFVVLQGMTHVPLSNGLIVQIATVSSTGFTANWPYTSTAIASGAEGGTATAKLLVTDTNVPVTTGTVATITNSVTTASSAGTAGVITLTAAQKFAASNIVVVQGLTNGHALNGQILPVIATGLTNALFEANGITPLITTAADSGTATLLMEGSAATPQQALVELPAGTDLSSFNFNLLLLGN